MKIDPNSSFDGGSADIFLPAVEGPFDKMFSRPLLRELSPEDRARRVALEQRDSIEYFVAWRVMTHGSNLQRHIASKLLSDDPKALAYYKREWNWDAVEAKLKVEADKFAAWVEATKSEGVIPEQILYEVYDRKHHNVFVGDGELGSLVKRLARVFINIEKPALSDSVYLNLW